MDSDNDSIAVVEDVDIDGDSLIEISSLSSPTGSGMTCPALRVTTEREKLTAIVVWLPVAMAMI